MTAGGRDPLDREPPLAAGPDGPATGRDGLAPPPGEAHLSVAPTPPSGQDASRRSQDAHPGGAGEADWYRWRGRGRGRGRTWRGGRPPWWPEGEAWPPQGRDWHAMRRHFLLRLGLLAFAVLLLAVVGPIALIWAFLTGAGVHPALAALVALLGPILLIAAVGRLVGIRSIASPLGDLVEAAGRVEAGDYGVRVPEGRGGPPELRSLVRAFNAMASRLESDERQRRTLLADISHEFRTPLAILQGELEALSDGVHPPDQAHLAATLDETRVLTRLVEDLRTLALAEAGTLALHREPTDLGLLAQDVATGFEELAGRADVRLAVEAAPGLPLLDVDPVRIREVLDNLVANAVRYAPAGSKIRIEVTVSGSPGLARPAGRRVLVSVLDAGPGIPAELLAHVFDRFSRSPDSRGSGLGLAIARYLVEAHGGAIEALQPAGGGTLVRFELPAA